MSKTSFHVDPAIEGAVVGILENAGFELNIGNGPMVDFTVDEPTDDKPTMPNTSDEIIEGLINGDISLEDADQIDQTGPFDVEFKFHADGGGGGVILNMGLNSAWRSDGLDDSYSEFDIHKVDV